MNYYNEFDPKAAAWLRELIKAQLIPNGDVDERSITEVNPEDLAQYPQCHFFAGIGGWSYALRLAGWPEDRPVWTGSCPCQPFSAAGKGLGEDDPRHLWPSFRWLIQECEPPVVFGEQVASKAGRQWLSGVRADLETLGYGVGAADLCAAGVGAPHIRQRLFWVAESGCPSNERGIVSGDTRSTNGNPKSQAQQRKRGRNDVRDSLPTSGERLALSSSIGSTTRIPEPKQWQEGQPKEPDNSGCRESARLDHTESDRCEVRKPLHGGLRRERLGQRCEPGGLDHATSDGAEHGQLPTVESGDGANHRLSGSTGHWDDYYLAYCRDGKTRRIGQRLLRVADGIFASLAEVCAFKNGQTPEGDYQWEPIQPLSVGETGRVYKLRGYGNAIIPQIAAQFIQSYLEI